MRDGCQVLAEQLDAFLAYAGEGVLLWDDPDGRFAGALPALELPGDVVLLREEEGARFELKRRLNGLGPDERALLYRTRRHRVEEGDWFSDVEAGAACFEPACEFDCTPEPESALPEERESSALILDDGFSDLRNQLEDDWYSHQAFCHAAGLVLGVCRDLPVEILARQTGFTVYSDCVLRDTWKSLVDYYASLFQAPIVMHDSVPGAMHAAGSFKSFLLQRMAQGQLFDYDEESWICPSGLRELGIGRDDLRVFVDAVVAACNAEGVPYLTVPWLRRCASEGLDLLGFELHDAFYESVLLMRRFALGRSSLCGRRLFSVRNASPRGRDFVFALLKREGSMPMGDLLEIMRDDYAIPIAPAQVAQLIRSSGAYYRQELDRAYVSHDQFIREME